MQVIPGELSIVTGVPNSGKSEWLDALLCNLSQLYGWQFALCSMEKKVAHMHMHSVQHSNHVHIESTLGITMLSASTCQAA